MTINRTATLALMALTAAAALAAPASAKDNYKHYKWNKFANNNSSTTSTKVVKRSKTRVVIVEDTGCGSYWNKWKATGDNQWRGRYYACVYGGY